MTTSDSAFDLLEQVSDEASFIRFVEALATDRLMAEGRVETPDGFRGEWANQSIVQFLEGASSWAKDSSFGQKPGPRSSNLWKLFASFLWAGRCYE